MKLAKNRLVWRKTHGGKQNTHTYTPHPHTHTHYTHTHTHNNTAHTLYTFQVVCTVLFSISLCESYLDQFDIRKKTRTIWYFYRHHIPKEKLFFLKKIRHFPPPLITTRIESYHRIDLGGGGGVSNLDPWCHPWCRRWFRPWARRATRRRPPSPSC